MRNEQFNFSRERLIFPLTQRKAIRKYDRESTVYKPRDCASTNSNKVNLRWGEKGSVKGPSGRSKDSGRTNSTVSTRVLSDNPRRGSRLIFELASQLSFSRQEAGSTSLVMPFLPRWATGDGAYAPIIPLRRLRRQAFPLTRTASFREATTIQK